MEKILEIIKRSNDYILGRIQERASHEELEELIRLKIKHEKNK